MPESSGTTSDQICLPAAPAKRRILTLSEIDGLAGEFALTVVATQGFLRDSVVRGRLSLWIADSPHRYYTGSPDYPDHVSDSVTFPLAGASDVDLETLGEVSLAYSVGSRNRDRPGVQGTRSGGLVFGNAAGPQGMNLDAGVFFQILAITGQGFSGDWIDGGRRSPLPAGVFCAVRLPPVG